MQFVNPFILFGLVAIAIPIIVHLFKFRRFRKVYFTNVKFIEELKMETQRQSRLKHLLVLFLRILAISFLVFAFAQPYIPVSENNIKKGISNAVSIYIDNSFSMESMSEDGILFDVARSRAQEIATIYEPSDVFQLLTNDFESRHQRFVSKDELIDMIGELKISPVVRNLSEVFDRQVDMLRSEKNKIRSAYIISDFQKSTSDFNNFKNDTTVSTYLIPVEANVINNLYIDSCWFESPVKHINQHVKLNVRIVNVSDLGYENIPVKLIINGRQKSVASFDMPAYGKIDVEMPFTNTEAGIQFGSLQITDYPVIHDDIFYFSYTVSAAIPLLCINKDGESKYLNSLFSKDSAFVFNNTSIKRINYSEFNDYRLIILNELNEISSGLVQELKRYMDNGGNLLIIPSKEIDIENYREFLTSVNVDYYSKLDTINNKVSSLDIRHPIFRDVFDDIAVDKGRLPENTDLPVVGEHYKINQLSTSKQDVLISLQNGDPFLSHNTVGKGDLYLLAVSLDEQFSNFPRHAIFVPSLYNIALLSDPVGKLYFNIGDDDEIVVRYGQLAGDQVFRIKKLNSDFEIIPEHKYFNSLIYFYTHGQLSEAGNYVLLNGNDSVIGISANYNRNESDLEVYSPDDILTQLNDNEIKGTTVLQIKEKPLAQTISEMSQGKRLWKLFILLALLMLGAEIIILRLWK